MMPHNILTLILSHMKMKYGILRTCLLAIGLASSALTVAQVPDGTYRIEGRVKNVPDGAVMQLIEPMGIKLLKPVATDTVRGGRFCFTDTISAPAPRKLYLISDSKGFPNSFRDIWVQSGKNIVLEGTDCRLPLWKVRSSVKEQRHADEFLKVCMPARERAIGLLLEAAACLDGSDTPDRARMDSLYNLLDREDSVMMTGELEYMKKAPVTTAWMDKYLFYLNVAQSLPWMGARQDDFDALYRRMSEADKATPMGQAISAYQKKQRTVNVGDEMADANLYDVEGRVHRLSELRGKYILLDFWSVGCFPCRLSFPEMEEIIDAYKDKLEVVGINMDVAEPWKEVVAKEQLKGNQWNEMIKGNTNTGLGAAYQVKGIPHYVMISPEGKVLQMWSGYGKGKLKQKVEKWVK